MSLITWGFWSYDSFGLMGVGWGMLEFLYAFVFGFDCVVLDVPVVVAHAFVYGVDELVEVVE
jgi:hypothetical protein